MTTDFCFVGMPPGTILLTLISSRIECIRKQPWQRNNVTCKGLPCTAAFACTDYKVQGRTLEQVALELRGTRTTNINSLYVQLSRCTLLGGIMLLLKMRERDVVGNTVPESMEEAEKRLEELSEATIKEAEENWMDWDSVAQDRGEDERQGCGSSRVSEIMLMGRQTRNELSPKR
ncbi:hypothetical protein K469DRAFT_692598 [Zopfia rhizophila CBS 207.26]|uniref:Uncharacterized protein n=1 Tax=Zopfia rhizophila CBS 207.26 TaxID=1314779 RepID=A0A6A6DMJ1_9PEZI|nr:hypothetical protein K469DRAFT_692598 [Zopfia rhizophila CBS 207.26]